MSSFKTLRLILGDQLNANHSWYAEKNKQIIYTMMELRQETDYTKHHIQKISAFFAAMREFAKHLKDQGHRVTYFRLDDKNNFQSFKDNILHLVEKNNIAEFEYLMPDEYRLVLYFKEMAKKLPVTSRVYDTEHFFTQRHAVSDFFKHKKQYRMESFYRYMRKKHQILTEGTKPHGGKWNYDSLNRKPYDKKTTIPPPIKFENDVSHIKKMIDRMKVPYFGKLDEKKLIWPVSVNQARELLDFFIHHCLSRFGTYQDAMTADSWSLFHSRLSFPLNTKMLHPSEVIDAAILYWESKRSQY